MTTFLPQRPIVEHPRLMSIKHTSLSPSIKDSEYHIHQEKPAAIAIIGIDLHSL
jgi:hypothetical protein